MNKYIVAYLSLHYNVLSQTEIEATSERDAMIKYLARFEDITFTEQDLLSMEDAESIASTCFDMDSFISAYQI